MIHRALAVCLLVSAARAQGAVHVVGPAPGPGVDFTTIGAAVAAAHDGDTILVRTGSYPAFAVNGRSLAITAEQDASVVVTGGTFVIGVPASGFVSLRGMRLQGDEFSAALNLANDAGPVWVENCTLRGFDQELLSIFAPGTPALHASDADSLVLTACTLWGGQGLSGEPALIGLNSTLHLFECTLMGAPGQCEDPPSSFCGVAGAALRVQAGFVTAQSSTLVGGAAAAGHEPCPGCPCDQSGVGGAALELLGGAPAIDLYDVLLQPGAATPPCGAAGQPLTGAGDVTETRGPAFSLSGGGPVGPEVEGELVAHGSPGNVAWLLFAPQPGDTWIPELHAPLLLSAPLLLPLGHVGPSGTLSLSFHAPPLPPGVEGVPIALQGARVAAGNDVLLANSLRPVILAAGL